MRLTLLAAVTILLAGCTQGATREFSAPEADAATGDIPVGPAWSFTDLDGVERSRDRALDSPSAIFFMATWCSKCQGLAPRLATVEQDYLSRGFQMHTVSWDPQENDGDLRAWKARYNQDWPHGIDAGSHIAQTFGITSQSSVVILDGHGNPVRTWVYASPSAADLRTAIDEAFARSESQP